MAGKSDMMNSTIGEGSVFEGKFYISGSLKIDGKFEGEIKTDEELVVGETGKVKTNIERRADTMGLKDKIFRIIVPTETELRTRGGKRVEVQSKVGEGTTFSIYLPLHRPAAAVTGSPTEAGAKG